MWTNVKSLTIQQPIPLSREFHRWVWQTLQTRCPYLHELTLSFEQDRKSKLNSQVESDYQKAIHGLPNPSFPNISNLTNLKSIHFKGIHDKLTAYFAQNLLQDCTPNLRHLHFCPITQPIDVLQDTGAFRIFEYLRQTPTLTENFQSFGFILGRYPPTLDDDDEDEVSTHPKLQRLSWTFNDEEFTLDQLFRHLLRLPELLPALTSYTLARNDNLLFPQNFWPKDMHDMQETTNILLNLSSSSNPYKNNNSSLQINLSMDLSCECYAFLGRRDCKRCYLQQFLRNHNDLPIQTPSRWVILRKYKSGNRFAHCMICK
jgi:hypothetical protein